ncbi:MAG: glycosyl hydrolase [Bacteroidetes bacterium GWF2_40_14]|nr:MAG: glycosyl hydrolase [Bacteroidetes bacterium GWF2_40_14]
MRVFFSIALLFLSLNIYGQKETISQRVDTLLSQMTLDEKIGQINQFSGNWEQTGPKAVTPQILDEIAQGRVGSLLNVHGAATTRSLQQYAMKSRLKIPLLFAQDVIHGYKTTFPIPLAEAASWDIKAIEKSARVAAAEASSAGIHWTFAPMVDICRDPRWGRVMEGAGEDTYLGSIIGAARVRGFQGNGIGSTDALIACAKHFAGYGASMAGRDYNTTDISDRTLWEVYLPPFESVVKEGVGSFMTAFNDLNGVPATGNKYLLTEVLRKKWGFTGMVVSDWGAIGELIPHGFAKDGKEAACKALLAGCEIDMESHLYKNNLKQLVLDGEIDEKVIVEAVRHILYKKFELGLFEDPYKFSDEKREKETLGNAANKAFAREIAAKSIVLLKNNNEILPLTKKYKKISLIGPLMKSKADMRGNWSIVRWGDSDIVSPYEGIQKRAPKGAELIYSKGCEISTNDRSGFTQAIEVAKNSDVVIMAMGESWNMTGEAKSRTDISLPGIQEELIKEIVATGKPVVVLLMAGRPMTFEWTAANAGSILYTWWLGNEAGNAIADVLYGDYNPAARLPITIPRSVGQIPLFYNNKNTGRPLIDENNVSYVSAYIDSPNTPLYSFGYGLSYTRFEYSDLETSNTKIGKKDTLTVKCKVKNIGKYDGEEVVQLYLRDISASVTRPVKELKGFDKIFIKAGETKEVEFKIGKELLAFYDINMKRTVECGMFELMIGQASDKIVLREMLEVIKL